MKDQKFVSEVDHKKLKGIKLKLKNQKNDKNKNKLVELSLSLQQEEIKVHEAITEPGASNWLNAIPMNNQGFYLNKQSFWDALHLRYNIRLKKMPEKCVCGCRYDIKHALSCSKGGFVSMRHNEVRDLTAEWMNVVCNDVSIEPTLTPLSGEHFVYKTANKEEGARTDVAGRGFWVRGQKAFVDIRIFNPLARHYSNQSLKAAHRKNENEKKRTYNERINQVEHSSFTPLVFSCYGGMSHECQHFYRRLAAKIAEKRNDSYDNVINFLRTKLSFSLIKSMILCVRGSRMVKQHGMQPISEIDITNELNNFKLYE